MTDKPTIIHIAPTQGDHCPSHPDVDPECGYGLAGGGMGSYLYCPECGYIIVKSQDPEMEDSP